MRRSAVGKALCSHRRAALCGVVHQLRRGCGCAWHTAQRLLLKPAAMGQTHSTRYGSVSTQHLKPQGLYATNSVALKQIKHLRHCILKGTLAPCHPGSCAEADEVHTQRNTAHGGLCRTAMHRACMECYGGWPRSGCSPKNKDCSGHLLLAGAGCCRVHCAVGGALVYYCEAGTGHVRWHRKLMCRPVLCTAP